MEYANDKFEILINELMKIASSLHTHIDRSDLSIANVSRTLVLTTLFEDADTQNKKSSSADKINKKGRPLNNKNIENCMKRLWSCDDFSFNDFSDTLDFVLTARTNSETSKKRHTAQATHQRDLQIKREDNYARSDEIRIRFNNKIEDLYKHYNPYPWINFDNLSSYDSDDFDEHEISVTCHKLLYLVTFVGLHINNLQRTKTSYVEIELSDFATFAASNMHFIMFGPPSCGKTAFLKNYALENNSSVFYIDANEIYKKPNEYETILKTLRPDYKFWKDAPISNELRSAYLNPWDVYPEISSRVLTAVISSDDTLILDNITCTEQLKYYSKFLPCRIIFATNQPSLSSEIPVYDFCLKNMNNLSKIVEGMIEETLDSETVTELLSNLGTDLYVYRLVAQNYKKLKEKTGIDSARDFLFQIVSSREIESFNSSIDQYGKYKLSMQYGKDKSTSRYIRDFIRHLYSTNLTDTQQKILHLLYRCQLLSDGKISAKKIFIYLNPESTRPLIDELVNLGWLTENASNIPLVIAASLNNVKHFSNQEYTEFLNIIGNFSVLIRGLSNINIDKEICNLLIRAIHEEFKSYVKERGEKPNNEVQEKYYNKMNRMTPEETIEFRMTGLSPQYYKHNDEDPIGNFQFMDWLVINEFYFSAILFNLQYGFINDAQELLRFASETKNVSYVTEISINSCIWELRMAILANSLIWDNLATPHLLEDAFERYAHFQPHGKNAIGRRSYDDKPILITMYHKALLDFQYTALQLWERTRGVQNYDPELIDAELIACANPFLIFKIYKCYYKLCYSKEEMQVLNEPRILNGLFDIFDKISKVLCRSQDLLFPGWNIDGYLQNGDSAYNLCEQYHALYHIMRIYHFSFQERDSKTVSESQNELQQILDQNRGSQFPVFIDRMVSYAMDAK